jgi:hypothetical protein
MSWATKRKYTIIASILILCTFPVLIFLYRHYHKPPTCFDTNQNQGERGIDCGGPCDLMCNQDTLPPIVAWERLFKVAPGLYTAVAYIENPNIGAGADDVSYVFRVYGEEGIAIAERTGTARLVPKHSFAIIEPGITVGSRVPTRMTFDIVGNPVWYKESVSDSPLNVVDEKVSKEDTGPRVDAILENPTVQAYKDILVNVVLYDDQDNALGASKTFVERLLPSESIPLVFTWPEPFKVPISRIEIIPQI